MKLSTLQRPIRRVSAAWPTVLRMAPGAAWFFIVFSLAHLAWVIGVKWSDPAGLTTLYQTTVDGETLRAWGLGYDGTVGLLAALVQFGAVGAAAVMSVMRTEKWRRLGHGVLIAWAAVWMIGLLRLAVHDGMIETVLQAGLATALFAATVYRAKRAFPKRGTIEVVAVPEPELELLTQELISSSDRVSEITSERATRRNPFAWIRRLPWRRAGELAKATPGKVKAVGAKLFHAKSPRTEALS